MVRQANGLGLQMVRSFSRKAAEYPTKFKYTVDPKDSFTKDHRSFLNRYMKSWLGPKNIRGEYYKNKYYYPPQNHQPNYIVQDGITDGTVVESSIPNFRKRDPLAPFPENPHCITGRIVSNELRGKILADIAGGLHIQQAAHKYGMKMERVEALVTLNKIRGSFKKEENIEKDLKKFSTVMYKMFPLFDPPSTADNLTEIPEPSRTLHQRFLSIAESEPFGPVDAAKVYNLEPASVMLEKLQSHEENNNTNAGTQKVWIAAQKESDRTLFKFSNATSGKVGYRYGVPKRDRKKNRRVGYNAQGQMIYL